MRRYVASGRHFGRSGRFGACWNSAGDRPWPAPTRARAALDSSFAERGRSTNWRVRRWRSRARLPAPPRSVTCVDHRLGTTSPHSPGDALNAASTRQDASRGTPKSPLREHVAQSVRRYLRDLNGCDADDVYEIVLREMEIPLFVEVLNHCEGNQSRAAALLGIHRATLRKKLKDYGLT